MSSCPSRRNREEWETLAGKYYSQQCSFTKMFYPTFSLPKLRTFYFPFYRIVFLSSPKSWKWQKKQPMSSKVNSKVTWKPTFFLITKSRNSKLGKNKCIIYGINLQNEQHHLNKSHQIEIQKSKTPTANT